MRVHVDLVRCESNGLCVLAAPEVFDLDEAGQLHYHSDSDEILTWRMR